MNTAYGNLYVTMNTDPSGKLFEVFATMGKAGGLGASMTEAICRLISISLRSGVSPRALIKELRGITDQPFWFGDNRVTSVADAIGKAVENFLYPKLDLPGDAEASDSKLPLGDSGSPEPDQAAQAVSSLGKLAGICPDCGGSLEFASGCKVCHSCGYSACG